MKTLNFLRPREEQRLLALEKPLMHQVIVQLPLRTGIGPGEFVELQAEDVMFEFNMLYVWRSKVSRDHPAKCDSETMWLIWRYLDKRKTGRLLALEGSTPMRAQYVRRVVKRLARQGAHN